MGVTVKLAYEINFFEYFFFTADGDAEYRWMRVFLWNFNFLSPEMIPFYSRSIRVFLRLLRDVEIKTEYSFVKVFESG